MSIISGIWNRIENASVSDNDPPELKRKKVTLVVIALCCSLTAIIFASRYYLLHGLIYAVILPGIYVIVVGTAIVLFFLTRRFQILLYSFLTMNLFIPILFHLSWGGFSGQTGIGTIIWAVLAPFGALMFLRTRTAFGWFIAYLLFVIIAYIIDENFTHLMVTASYKELIISHLLSVFMLSTTIFFSMMYFVNAFKKEHKKVERLVDELQKSNSDLETTLNELQATQSELVQSEKMAGLGKLAAGLAHEINNPIGALKSTADTSRHCLAKIDKLLDEDDSFKQVKTHEKFQSYLKILRDGSAVVTLVSERVSNTVKGFISFARLDKAGFDKVNLQECIDDTLRMMRHEIKAETKILKDYGDPIMAACYPGELNQVFMNILTNAAQAIKKDGQITVKTYAEEDQIFIQIIDTGAGIPVGKIPELFNPGFTKNSERVRAGLGLFTSYNIVRKHRGEIRVESTEGGGSTFTIVLPNDLKSD